MQLNLWDCQWVDGDDIGAWAEEGICQLEEYLSKVAKFEEFLASRSS